jgi:hypothetical protein
MKFLSRLNSMAFGLAAYVSRLGYPSPRKAGFQALVRLSWAGFHPQGSNKRFQFTSCVILLFQTSWHNVLGIPFKPLKKPSFPG